MDGIDLPITMLAIRKRRSAPGLDWVTDAPLPAIGPRDVLMQVTHAGICGTDRHIYEWDRWSQNRVRVGIITGHEFVGRVVRIGAAVQRVAVGQRVSVEGHVGCQQCEACRTGRAHICERVRILGIDCDGGFAQFAAVPEDNLWPVHPQVRDEVAAIFDPLGNAVHTVSEAGVSGAEVLITGVGTIGLMAVAVARHFGATRVFAVDVDAERLKLARRLGADEVFSASSTWIPEIKRLTGGGPEVLLEMSGHPSALVGGLEALRNGGRAALLGIPSSDVSLDLPRLVIFKGATLLGINGRRMFQTWYQAERFVLAHPQALDSIITHVLPLQDFERGLKMMQSGEAIKVVLTVPPVQEAECRTHSSTSVAIS